MVTIIERSEVDQAVSSIARRHADDDQVYAEMCAALAGVHHAVQSGRGDERWVAAWWEHRDGVDILHLVPGPALLDLLLPPATIGAWLDRASRGR